MADRGVYLMVARLPHPAWCNRFMRWLSWWMKGGNGWLVGLLISALLRPSRRTLRTLASVAPATWLAAQTVEGPVKSYFRRRRPFFSIRRAVVIGRRPGGYSFPSGHSAASFAAAALLSRRYPKYAWAFTALAALVAFARVYLGVHYPGDVLAGAVTGTVLADGYALAQRRAVRWTAKTFPRSVPEPNTPTGEIAAGLAAAGLPEAPDLAAEPRG